MTSDVEVLVVGGGIHGAGVLQAAAAAGHSALLLEERALAAGTSSRSSKLIHGGLRYLESGQLALVRESLRERQILARLAPDLVKLVPFHVPVYANTTRAPRTIRAGLALYSLLGNLRREALFRSLARNEWDALDGLVTRDLLAVFRYFDGQTDDAALTRAVVASAVGLGAEALVGARFLGAQRDGDGYLARYEHDGRETTVRCRALVNASGPWIERVRAVIHPKPPGFDVELVTGAHVELEGALEHGIYYVEAPSDRRAVFAIPWKGRTMVGTTETPYAGDPAAIVATQREVDYLIATFAHYFPTRSVRVLASWAGARVLPKLAGAAFHRPRETTLVADDDRAPAMIAIYGGKLTGYRATAERVLAKLEPSLPARKRLALTSELPLRADAQ